MNKKRLIVVSLIVTILSGIVYFLNIYDWLFSNKNTKNNYNKSGINIKMKQSSHGNMKQHIKVTIKKGYDAK